MTLTNLAIAYGQLGDPRKQKDLLERSLKIQEKHFGADHFQVAITLGNLGNANGKLGDPSKQKDLLERALKIEEKHFGEEHFEVAKNVGQPRQRLWRPGRSEEAEGPPRTSPWDKGTTLRGGSL